MFICDKVGFILGRKLNIYFLKEFEMSHCLQFIYCFYILKYLTKPVTFREECIQQISCTVVVLYFFLICEFFHL